MAGGMIEAHRAMLDPGELTIEDLLEEPAEGSEAPLMVHDGSNPVFDYDASDGMDTYDQLDANMMQNPQDSGGPEDIEALREMLIERARGRHMATDEFQHQLGRTKSGGRV